MSDKKKIICIYTGVAVISALILFSTWWIRGRHVQDQPEEKPYYAQDDKFEPLLRLEKDLMLKRQDGVEVRISDLKGKVWAFAQFYASCPMCAQRNTQGLKQLYERFKDRPGFQMVCITVNPESDGVTEMLSYAGGLGADTSKWWFLTGDAESLKQYMTGEMKYQEIVKRTDADEIASKGEYEHDMSIAVYDRELGMVGRYDLYNARKKGEAFYKGEENKLHFAVETLLGGK